MRLVAEVLWRLGPGVFVCLDTLVGVVTCSVVAVLAGGRATSELVVEIDGAVGVGTVTGFGRPEGEQAIRSKAVAATACLQIARIPVGESCFGICGPFYEVASVQWVTLCEVGASTLLPR